MTIAPLGRAYRGAAVQLDLPVLAAGTREQLRAPDTDEVVAVLLAGQLSWAGGRATRRDVFDARASAVYLPAGCAIEIEVHEKSELAIVASVDARLTPDPAASPICIGPDDVVVHERGRAPWSREVHDVVVDRVAAQRLLVGETFNRQGEWSSFPPHKHDGAHGEPALEEVYYFRFDRPQGFGFQGLYTDSVESGTGDAVLLRHGTVVGIPGGYHPVVAAPGYRLYYLWAIGACAGSPRALATFDDPAHAWLARANGTPAK